MQRQIGVYVQEQAKLFDKLVMAAGRPHDFAKSDPGRQLQHRIDDRGQRLHRPRRPGLPLRQRRCALCQLLGILPAAVGTDAAGNPFKPEEGRQDEVGIEVPAAGLEQFRRPCPVFDLVKQNVLTPDPADPVNNQVQTGEIRSRGIELEGVASFDFGLDVTLAYTFLDAEITKSNADGEQGNRPGQTAASTRASLWADYTIPEGDFAGLGVGAGVRYIGPSFRRQPRGPEAFPATRSPTPRSTTTGTTSTSSSTAATSSTRPMSRRASAWSSASTASGARCSAR